MLTHGTLRNQLGNQGGSLSTYTSGVRRVLRFLETLARGTQQSTLDALPIQMRSSAGVVASAAQSTHSVGGRGYSESSHGVSSVITRALGVLTVLTRRGALSTHSGYTEYPRGEAGAPICRLGTLIAPTGDLSSAHSRYYEHQDWMLGVLKWDSKLSLKCGTSGTRTDSLLTRGTLSTYKGYMSAHAGCSAHSRRLTTPLTHIRYSEYSWGHSE